MKPDQHKTDLVSTGPDKTELVETAFDSPFGSLRVVASDAGLRAILWPADAQAEVSGNEQVKKKPRVRLGPTVAGQSEILDQTIDELTRYFAGSLEHFDVPIDPQGTEFQLTVWRALANIPYGQTTTYGKQANALGQPKAIRAVASANGKNPLSIVLPCHRIIGADGSLTGFAGGLDAKAWLLGHEGGMLAV